MQLVPVFEVRDACDLAQTEKGEYVMRCSASATAKARKIMKKCAAIAAVIGILLAGDGSGSAGQREKHETVESLITTVVEAKEESLGIRHCYSLFDNNHLK